LRFGSAEIERLMAARPAGDFLKRFFNIVNDIGFLRPVF
jgi:hypothetical protein